MLNLSLVELKTRIRGIKGYENMSKDRLLSALKVSESLNFDDTETKMRIKKIRKELEESRHKFSKSKIKDTKTNLYEIENEKECFCAKSKRD